VRSPCSPVLELGNITWLSLWPRRSSPCQVAVMALSLTIP
jgi:hypothetical protein